MTDEANLWREVLHLAIHDALNGSRDVTRPKSKIKQTYQARKYLTVPNADFNQVCHLAGLDPIAVRDAVTKQIANARSPEDLATTKERTKADQQLTFEGTTRTIAEWAEQIGVSKATLISRLKSGWPIERALASPQQRRGVVHDFEGALGTGGGTSAQESTKIDFPKEATQ